ncbi:MAG: hypothetical protein Kow001_12900 [Acidobacteriota bacterium]
MLWLGLAGLGQAADPAGAVNSEEARLKLRIELARKNSLFLEHRADAVEVLAAGWKLKRFGHTGFQVGRYRPPRLTRVVEVLPLEPPPQKVLDVGSAEAPDPSGTAGSLEDIVGVEQMPDIFVVRFDDGTTWMVEGERWPGLWLWARKRLLRLRLEWANLRAEHPAPLWFMKTEPASARHLYWILQKDFQVIQ